MILRLVEQTRLTKNTLACGLIRWSKAFGYTLPVENPGSTYRLDKLTLFL